MEQLEARYLLSADTLLSLIDGNVNAAQSSAAPMSLATSPFAPRAEVLGGAGSALEVAPFPLEETFFLHSLPGATKTIYLDFDGHITRETQWNTDFSRPNIITPSFDMDGDVLQFSSAELETIQYIWERVVEDFRPFNVNVTTQDPGVAALSNSGGGDNTWGIRVLMGGTPADWYTPVTGNEVGGVAYLGSFASGQDVPCFVFNVGEFATAETISHEVGHTLGLAHDGQFRDWIDVTDPAAPVWHTEYVEYYNGHGFGPTSWAPIMGVAFPTADGHPEFRDLTQWSKGEYGHATNNAAGSSPLQDDLAIITEPDDPFTPNVEGNGLAYRADDHGNDMAAASLLDLDDTETMYFGEGIIEQNTDVDYFTFTVEGLGEVLVLDISPFVRGPNLDILAKLYDSSGAVIATSNPIDGLYAGAQTFGGPIDGGWRLADDTYTNELLLGPGTYYVSVEGTGRPLTFLDPTMPPEVAMPPDPLDPLMDLPYDQSDWGYSDYGSLGYFSITGTRKTGLVVGVEFDEEGGNAPRNWRQVVTSSNSVFLSNLRSEAGVVTPYDLLIQMENPASSIETFPSENPINPADLPVHALPLNELGGYVTTGGETLTFVWSDLEPGAAYNVYVFGHADQEVRNVVEVVGGEWAGEENQTFNFTQTVSADGLVVNDFESPGGRALTTMPLLVIAEEILDAQGNPTGEGRITIHVTNEVGFAAAIAGVAIAPTKVGSIQGRKFNDLDGDRIQDGNESGLPGWTMYLDLNNDGELNLETIPATPVMVAAPNVPQLITDGNTFKNELNFTQQGIITDVNVTLDISHTFNGDLDIYLISPPTQANPTGIRVKLVDDEGGNSDNFTNTTFDDQAAVPITSGTGPFTGSFRPEQPLSVFNGLQANGIWQLEVTDDAIDGQGTLNSWSVTITLGGFATFLEPVAVTDANGNYSFTNLQPGVYNVREHFTTQQWADGWRSSFPGQPNPDRDPGRSVTVGSGVDVPGIHFGNWIPILQHGSIQGQKFNDIDGDGVKGLEEEGLEGWVIYIDSNGNNMRDSAGAPVTASSTDVPKPISENLPPATSKATFDGIGTVVKVEVTLDITHSFVGDLTARLRSPSGSEVELFSAVGGQFNDMRNLKLADGALLDIDSNEFIASYDTGLGYYTGSWRPEEMLSLFNGESAEGDWTLEIQDSAHADLGVLNGWSITITLGEVFTTTDENGFYIFDNLPAGQHIVREEQQPGWLQVAPLQTLIPGAEWMNSEWAVTIPADPNVPPELRDVLNVDFGNRSGGLPGDFNGDGSVNMADYLRWRKTLSTSVNPPGSGADGNANGTVDYGDLAVWQDNYGTSGGGGGGAQAEANLPGETSAAISSTSPAIDAEMSSESTAGASSTLVLTASEAPSVAASEQGNESEPVVATAPAASALQFVPFSAAIDVTQGLGGSIVPAGTLAGSGSASDAALVAWLAALSDEDETGGDVDAIDTEYDEWSEESSDLLEPIDSVFAMLGAGNG